MFKICGALDDLPKEELFQMRVIFVFLPLPVTLIGLLFASFDLIKIYAIFHVITIKLTEYLS